MRNQFFMDFINVLSFMLQVQNQETLKIDSMRDEIEERIDKQIITRLDTIINQLKEINSKL